MERFCREGKREKCGLFELVGTGTMAHERSLYRLNGVAHVTGSINEQPTKCIYSVRRQQNMSLHERIILYLEWAGLYHLARLNVRRFWLDKPLVSAFIERWRPEMHTFHMPFEECTITLDSTPFPSHWLPGIDMCTIIWEPYASLDVMAVVHPKILTEEHSRLWRACTCLIYFAVIEWHQVDRVLPQLGGVQHEPESASNIDWLHAKDGRGGDRWFPSYYQGGGDQSGCCSERFVIGAFWVPMSDVPDNRRVERRRRIGTWATNQEWRWLDEMIQDDIVGGDVGGHADHRVQRGRPRPRGGASGVAFGGPSDRPTEQAGAGS
ncbi:uncharacterized protein DS421_7g207720 [Arachis hypogaea]|nr:uncharacterized protein DS421_7g207720 [Arachis hypogaea]